MAKFFESLREPETVNEYEDLSEIKENQFDAILQIAALSCKVPFSVLNFIEGKKVCVYGNTTINAEIFKDNCFFEVLFKNPDSVLEVNDANVDERFKYQTIVNAGIKISSCVSIPLTYQDGSFLGALSVMHQVPGRFSEHAIEFLKLLGNQIVKQVEFNKDAFNSSCKNKINFNRLLELRSKPPEYIFTIDRNLNITYLNHVGAKTHEPLLNANAASLVDFSCREEYINCCSIAFSENKIIEKEFLIRFASYNESFFVTFSPLINKQGEVDSLLQIVRNVTPSQYIREELLKQQTILSEAEKISNTGCCEWNIRTGEAKFSNELLTILEIEKGNGVHHINELTSRIHPDDINRAKQLTTNALKSHSSLLFQYRIITPGGKLKYIDGRGCPLVIKGKKVVAALITLHDITESINFDKKLFTSVVQSEEKERERMAAELHDGVCQYLAGSKLMLTTIENALTDQHSDPDWKSILKMVQYSKSTLIDGLELTRQISHNLLPTEFHKKGIIASVKEMAEHLNTTNTLQYKVETSGVDTNLDPNISINIFRIIQEFIRNSQKYSEATWVNIMLAITNHEIKLEINDNGKGFDFESVQQKKGVGLLSMQKRVQSIGGTFNYITSPGNGVQLNLKMTAYGH